MALDQFERHRHLALPDHRRRGGRGAFGHRADAAAGKSIGGFGSLKVEARIGDSVFKTSLFPSRELGWLLPVKAAVRKAEGVCEGDEVEAVLEV